MNTTAAVYQSFLDDILTNPDDDAPRLIFADWLDENSLDPADHCHAGLIRVQCELEPLRGHIARCGKAGRCRDCQREATLTIREREIMNSAGMEWLCTRECDMAELFWRRGFIERVVCELGVWMAHGPALVRRHPVQGVLVADRSPMLHDGNRPIQPRWFLARNPSAWIGTPWAVPQRLFAFTMEIDPERGEDLSYPTERQAVDALSRACLDFARSSTV